MLADSTPIVSAGIAGAVTVAISLSTVYFTRNRTKAEEIDFISQAATRLVHSYEDHINNLEKRIEEAERQVNEYRVCKDECVKKIRELSALVEQQQEQILALQGVIDGKALES